MGSRGIRRRGKKRQRRTAGAHVASFVLIVLFAVLPASRAAAELVDRIVASVNHDVVTLSELNQAIAFNSALSGEQGEKGESVREETLQGIINRHLLLQEASRLKFVDVTPQEVNGEVEKLKSRLGSERAFEEFLVRLDINREQLSKMLAERLLVMRFVEKKIGLFVQVSRDEAEEFYNKNQDRFKGKSFTDVQKLIMAGLQARKIDEQLDRYVAELRSKADIRVNRQ